MQLLPLRFRPGINRNLTRFSGEGSWFDCDKVRFSQGFPEAIGGWAKYTTSTFLGSCRSMIQWNWLDGTLSLGVGTTLKYYIYTGSYADITPVRNTTAAGDVTFSATNGSSVITVSDTAHGAVLNDFVTFSGAVSLGGNITAGILNAEHQITEIVNGDSYKIDVGTAANASDTGNGGASVVGEYQINVGLNTALLGTGWGADPWGDGGWGEAAATSISASLRIWTHDNFGEDLIFNARGGGIYYWDRTNPNNRAVALSDLAGANAAPSFANQVLVSDQDRHVICFGADPEDDLGTQDPLVIRWSDQENVAEWQTLTTNTAGSLRLSRGSEIIRAIQTKREIVVFTDASMHSMQFIGPPFTFGITLVAADIKLIGPQAVIAARDFLFWMEQGKFMKYDGAVSTLECTIEDYVFDDLNISEREKITAGHNVQFSEIWWFYPSSGSTENDRYAIYNYDEDTWAYGNLSRTAWISPGSLDYPLAAAPDGYIYSHEFGLNDGEQNPAGAIHSYVESSSVDIAEGDRFFFARRLIPDLTFGPSESGTPMADFTVKARRFPGSAYNDENMNQVMQTATTPIEQFTEQVFLRLRGRSFSVRVDANETNTWWRLGTPRIEVRTDGKR